VVADVRNFARSVRNQIRTALGGNVYRSTNALGAQAGDNYSRGFTSRLAGIGKVLSKILNPKVLLTGGKILAVVAALKQMILLAPAIAGLGQALAALGATLPALAITGILVSKTLSSAFKGVGEAMKAAAEGDAEALAAAMKNLTPAAQSFVKEVQAAQPALKDLQKAIQETFFTQFKGGFSALTDPSVIGALRAAMTGIAESLGKAAKGVADTIGAAGKSGQLSRIFAPLERAVERLTVLAPGLTTMFLRLAEVAAPFIESFAGVLAGKIGGLIAKVNEAAKDGTLKKFFETAISAAAAFGGVLSDLGRIFSAVFDGLNVEGSSVVGTLGTLIDTLADFFETAEGAGVLATIGSLLSAVGDIIHKVVGPLLKPAAQIIGTLAIGLGQLLANLGPSLGELATALGGLLSGLIEELGPEFFHLIGEISGPLANGITMLAEHITEMTPVAIEMARVFGPLMGFAFQQFGHFLTSLLPSLEFLARVISENSWLLMVLAGIIGTVFLAIGGGLWLLAQLIEGGRAFAELLYDNVWSNFPVMLGLITGAAGALLTALAGPIGSLGELWDTVVSGGERALNFIQSIPGAISSMAGAFFNAAASLGAAIGRGFAQIGNFASDIGNKIYGTIKNGINGIVRGINNGISQIDAVIPGSLPRLGFFARGGVITEPTMSVLGEGGRREVVLPLTDPARTAQLARESGLMDVLRGAGMGGGMPVINITAILDGFGVLKIVDQRVDTAMNAQGRELAFGTRGV
jgi:phage-related protein